MKQVLATYGPLTVSVDATSWQDYKKGVYTACTFSASNHAVQVVGYGVDAAAGDYWLIRNSWGETWGESGYIRIRRGSDCNGLTHQDVVYYSAPSSEDCSAKSCAQCTASSSCGWCGSTGSCEKGATDGPSQATCEGVWAFNSCADVPCAATKQDECLAHTECGWCGASNTCGSTNSSALEATCAHGYCDQTKPCSGVGTCTGWFNSHEFTWRWVVPWDANQGYDCIFGFSMQPVWAYAAALGLLLLLCCVFDCLRRCCHRQQHQRRIVRAARRDVIVVHADRDDRRFQLLQDQ